MIYLLIVDYSKTGILFNLSNKIYLTLLGLKSNTLQSKRLKKNLSPLEKKLEILVF